MSDVPVVRGDDAGVRVVPSVADARGGGTDVVVPTVHVGPVRPDVAALLAEVPGLTTAAGLPRPGFVVPTTVGGEPPFKPVADF